MIISKTITKKGLEDLIKKTFEKFGFITTSKLLDALKLLGFFYATNAGISINTEDLKIPKIKKSYIDNVTKKITAINTKLKKGNISEIERFQIIIDSWNSISDSLKFKIVEYYQKYDPLNSLYIMSFSGARGNISQVRQLVGLRGLMSDQEGKIIDIPIENNFREGLTSIDYIISSYGARKGIVDTALRTADSGYLTRRLIYVAQDFIIRDFDCKGIEGVNFLFYRDKSSKILLGRTILSIKMLDTYETLNDFNNLLITNELLKTLNKYAPIILKVSSVLTCISYNSICQKCYGLSEATGKKISIGETIGIVAAQSIGEPGTQLTMRTFHTGGVFTGETLRQIHASFSGQIIIPQNLKALLCRTNNGNSVLKLQQELNLELFNWEGKKEILSLNVGSYLYIFKSQFIYKNQLIAELVFPTKGINSHKLKPLVSKLNGQIIYENLIIRRLIKGKHNLKINEVSGIAWILPGEINNISYSSKYLHNDKLIVTKPFSFEKIITPFEGILKITNKNIYIQSFYSFKLINLNISFLNCLKTDNIVNFCEFFLKNFYFSQNEINKKVFGICKDILINYKLLKINFDPVNFDKNFIKYFFTVNTYQYVDKHTVLGYKYTFPKRNANIVNIRKKELNKNLNLFFITSSNIWTYNNQQLKNKIYTKERKINIQKGKNINEISSSVKSSFFLKKNGRKLFFYNAYPIYVPAGAILSCNNNDFIKKNQTIAYLIDHVQETKDIVQGLPKIEELIEARKPKKKSLLNSRPGILYDIEILNEKELNKNASFLLSDILHCYTYSKTGLDSIKNQLFINVVQNLFIRNKEVYFLSDNGIYQANFIFLNNKSFIYVDNNKLLFNNKDISLHWKRVNLDINLMDQTHKIRKLKDLLNIKFMFQNKKHDLILFNSSKKLIYLKKVVAQEKYELLFSDKILLKKGSFLDIGEQIIDGNIDSHELLNILFNYHYNIDGNPYGIKFSLIKFQIILANSIQSIYQSQGVNISNNHIEVIVKQMTSNVIIEKSGNTPLIFGEICNISMYFSIIKSLNKRQYKNDINKKPKAKPILISATNSALLKSGFLSAAGFQETKKVLTRAALESKSDWFRSLKECNIIGRTSPSGSTFLNYKNYLDNIYLQKLK